MVCISTGFLACFSWLDFQIASQLLWNVSARTLPIWNRSQALGSLLVTPGSALLTATQSASGECGRHMQSLPSTELLGWWGRVSSFTPLNIQVFVEFSLENIFQRKILRPRYGPLLERVGMETLKAPSGICPENRSAVLYKLPFTADLRPECLRKVS